MTAQELNTYIDKVLGNSIRCLLPSYWWRRVLKLIIEYTEVVDKKLYTLGGKVNTLESEVDSHNSALKKICKSTFVVTTGTDGGVNVIVDGKSVSIDSGLTKNIDFSNSFRIQSGGMYIDSLQIIRSNTVLNESMSYMFFNCWALTSLDVSNFDTSNVTNMSNMFFDCRALTSLDVSNFDTSNVTNMTDMFYDCMALTSLDVSNFDTSNVTNMSNMFYNCKALTSLDVSNFDTSNVTNMRGMFFNCSSLVTLTLGADFFKVKSLDTPLDFSSLANWSSESAIPSLVTNSYDRTANGLPNITINLHANTYAYLTDEHKASLTAKGYDVVQV